MMKPAVEGPRAQAPAGAATLRPLIGAVLLLIAGAVAVVATHRAHLTASANLVGATATLADARTRAEQGRRNTELAKKLAALQQHAQVLGVLQDQWSERQINLRQQSLTREQANQTLLGIARAHGQLLKLEEFDLSVTNAEEGLFSPLAAARQPVMLTLRGMTRFPITGAP